MLIMWVFIGIRQRPFELCYFCNDVIGALKKSAAGNTSRILLRGVSQPIDLFKCIHLRRKSFMECEPRCRFKSRRPYCEISGVASWTGPVTWRTVWYSAAICLWAEHDHSLQVASCDGERETWEFRDIVVTITVFDNPRQSTRPRSLSLLTKPSTRRRCLLRT